MSRARTVLDRIVREVDASGFRAHGLHVLAGEGTAEHRWTADVREDVHSITKGLCVLATGIAADAGLIDVDTPVIDLLPSIRAGAGVEAVTLRHLLSMSSGVDLPWSETEMADWPDLAMEFLGRPAPERAFQYSNASTYTAMAVLSTRVGDAGDFIDDRILAPLGIHATRWERCPNGRILAGGGLALRTQELARIGQLIRDRGVWRERRIVSAHWVDAMHEDWVPAGSSPGYERYALAGWDGPGAGWRLHGAHGQLLIFAGDAVVTLTAADHFGADAMALFVMDLLTA